MCGDGGHRVVHMLLVILSFPTAVEVQNLLHRRWGAWGMFFHIEE
jgi:hypothetical protein